MKAPDIPQPDHSRLQPFDRSSVHRTPRWSASSNETAAIKCVYLAIMQLDPPDKAADAEPSGGTTHSGLWAAALVTGSGRIHEPSCAGCLWSTC